MGVASRTVRRNLLAVSLPWGGPYGFRAAFWFVQPLFQPIAIIWRDDAATLLFLLVFVIHKGRILA